MPDDPGPVVLNAQGRPARRDLVAAKRCPRCGAGPEKRVASAGFGTPHPVCGMCGWDFHGEVWSA
jgi:uncharacterized protein (DUF983 family)